MTHLHVGSLVQDDVSSDVDGRERQSADGGLVQAHGQRGVRGIREQSACSRAHAQGTAYKHTYYIIKIAEYRTDYIFSLNVVTRYPIY